MQAESYQTPEAESSSIGARFPLGCTHESGTYVCNWSGHLIRVPVGAQPWTGAPFFNIVAREPLFLTKISDDPFVPLSKARQIASSLDVYVNF
jgi:hypothetical protein